MPNDERRQAPPQGLKEIESKWHRDYDPCVWRDSATEEHKRQGWEMWVRMEKIMCGVPRGAHERQAEEAMGALVDGPGRFYRSYAD